MDVVPYGVRGTEPRRALWLAASLEIHEIYLVVPTT